MLLLPPPPPSMSPSSSLPPPPPMSLPPSMSPLPPLMSSLSSPSLTGRHLLPLLTGHHHCCCCRRRWHRRLCVAIIAHMSLSSLVYRHRRSCIAIVAHASPSSLVRCRGRLPAFRLRTRGVSNVIHLGLQCRNNIGKIGAQSPRIGTTAHLAESLRNWARLVCVWLLRVLDGLLPGQPFRAARCLHKRARVRRTCVCYLRCERRLCAVGVYEWCRRTIFQRCHSPCIVWVFCGGPRSLHAGREARGVGARLHDLF